MIYFLSNFFHALLILHILSTFTSASSAASHPDSRPEVQERKDITTNATETIAPELEHLIDDDFAPYAPFDFTHVQQVRDEVHKYPHWWYYFMEVAIVNQTITTNPSAQDLGPWLSAVKKLLTYTVGKYAVPDASFTVSVLDEPYMYKARLRAPLLATLSTRETFEIMVPGNAFFENHGETHGEYEHLFGTEHAVAWDKKIERAFFRGKNWSSRNIEEKPNIDDSLRIQPKHLPCIEEYNRETGFNYRQQLAIASRTNPHLDVGLTPGAAFEIDGVAQEFAEPVALKDHGKYKYLLQLDGTTVSSRFMKLFRHRSLVFKQDSPFEEYFYRALTPGFHYLPFARDRCSTQNITQLIEWAKENDEAARRIADQGFQWSSENLSIDSAARYWVLVLHRYAKLQRFDVHLADPLVAKKYDEKRGGNVETCERV